MCGPPTPSCFGNRMIRIRPLEPSDIDAVLAITAGAPEAAAWNRLSYQRFVNTTACGYCEQGCCQVAEQDGQVVGFVCFRVIRDQAELLNLAVHPSFRRQGVGSRLLEETLAAASQGGATRIFLEVRPSNVPALRFYERHGFQVCGRRPGYYSDPPEDALELTRRLPVEDPPKARRPFRQPGSHSA